jgi:septal ring factor EnvC (AmiA/AmiB activator)
LGIGTKENLSRIFKFVQPIVTIGTIVFASGSLYADVRSIKQKVEKVETSEIQQALMTQEISQLHTQLENQNKGLDKLADSVNSLSISVAKLEAKIDDKQKHK